MFKFNRLLPALTLLLLVSGCATVEGWFSKDSNIIQSGVSLAVGETILGQKTPAAESALAVQIISVTQKVQSDIPASGSSTATVATLIAVAQAEITKLGNPQEVLAGETLLTALQPILVQYVGSGTLTSTAAVDLTQFCGWVIAAASPYTTVHALPQ